MISVHRLAVTVALVLVALMLAAGSAQAETLHDLLPGPSEEISKGVPASCGASCVTGVDGEGSGIAVLSGKVYLAEYLPLRIDVFDLSSGAFQSQFQPSADPNSALGSGGVAAGPLPATGEPREYVGGYHSVAVFNAAGSLLATWTGEGTPGGSFGSETHGVAVDNDPSGLDWASGDLYVASTNNVVDVLAPDAEDKERYVTQLTGPCATPEACPAGEQFAAVEAVAVDSANGDVLVAEMAAQPGGGSGSVDVFEPTAPGEYTFVRRITSTPAGTFFAPHTGGLLRVAVGSEGEVYIGVNNFTFGSVVDEFSLAGAYLGQINQFTAGGVSGLAVGEEGDVLVQLKEGVDVYDKGLVIPDVKTNAATEVKPLSATVNGAVNLDKEGAATCRFVWGTTTALKNAPVECEPPEVSAEGEVPVHAKLPPLQPDTTYYYRLEATSKKNGHTNLGEEATAECEGQKSQDGCFTTLGPDLVIESVGEVTSSTATLEATIIPHGSPTSYFFQYSTGSLAGCQADPSSCESLPGEAIGSGNGPVVVTPRTAVGLAGETVYHYRVVEVSEPLGVAEEFLGPERSFATQGAGAFALPDGRQWQLVSPPVLHGAVIESLNGIRQGVVQAAANGDAITYVTNEPNEVGVAGYPESAQVFSRRGAEGWSSRNLAVAHSSVKPTQFPFDGPEFRYFSEDLSEAIVQQYGSFVPLSPYASQPTPYLYDTTTGVYTPLDTSCQTTGPCERTLEESCSGQGIFCGRRVLSASPNAEHVLLSGLAESSGGSPTQFGGAADAPDYTGALSLRGTVSEDGAHVFFLGEEENKERHLYMRDVPGERTLQVDAPAPGCASCGGSSVAVFQLATGDGSRVLFTDHAKLTEGGESGLYECQIVEDACNLRFLAPGVSGLIPGASEDASWVYFVSSAVLGDGGERGAVAGGRNLYVLHGGTTKLVATLSGEDAPDWAEISAGTGASVAQLAARVSPNGQWLAFMSQRQLTGYDNQDAVSGASDEEVYLYDAASGRLACASCNPTGARPHGTEYEADGGSGAATSVLLPLVGGITVKEWPANAWLAANVPTWTEVGGYSLLFHQPRYLSNSGRLFFNSGDALVPKDVNGQWDVYEYEPEGVPSGEHACSPASASGSVVYKPVQVFEVEGHRGEEGPGCVGLISSGTSPEESAFMDASESGGDVFFITLSHLTPQANESGLAMYDAHECSAAVPCFSEVASPPACVSVEGCRAAPEPQPAIYGTPSSATFSGAGNITPESRAAVTPSSSAKGCRKGFARRKGVCVKVKAKRAKRAGRSRVRHARKHGRTR